MDRNHEDQHDDSSDEITSDELEALKDEVEVLHGGDTKEAAAKLLEERILRAILEMSKLATSASAERIRFDASKYIIERVLGPLNKVEPDIDVAVDPLVKMLKKAGIVD